MARRSPVRPPAASHLSLPSCGPQRALLREMNGVASLLLATLLMVLAACGHDSSSTPPPSASAQSLMRELRACLNVDRAEAIPADFLSSCPRKNVEALAGVSRDHLFSFLGKPSFCR